MNKIKVIFFDVDGTIMEQSQNMEKTRPSTIAAFYALKEKGIRVVVASGRTLQSVGYVTDFPFDGFISANGAINYADGNEIYIGGLTTNEARWLWDYLKANQVGFLFQGDALFVYHDATSFEVKKYIDNVRHRSYEKRIIQCDNLDLDDLFYKVTVFYTSVAQKEKAIEDLSEKYCLMFSEINSGVNRADRLGGEISSVRDTKGTGIEHLLDFWKIKPEEAIAFGDNSNDIDMFLIVDGFAMANSVQELKDKAFEMIGPVDSDTISELLKRKCIID